MFKRIIFYSILLLAVSLGVYKVYDKYQPKVAVVVYRNPIEFNFTNKYSFATFETYIVTTTEPVNVIFYQTDDINSQYFFNTVLTNIMAEKGVTALQNTLFVEVSDLPSDSITTKTRYGISSLPSLVNLSYADGTITINSSLSNNNASFDTETISQWLVTNKAIGS